MTSDLGQAEAVRLGNGTLLFPESHRPVLRSPGRDACGWIMGNIVDLNEGDFGVECRCCEDLRRESLIKGQVSRP